ncbi:oxyS [Symbiodinium microadriaticum]|nr:oxyS [Symbiodinium microadriaticum]
MADPRPLLAGQGTASELDCLVVGAGPVGLLLAAELSARGCQVAIIDALTEPAKITKASGVVPRSLEVLPSEVEAKLLKSGNLLKEMRILEKQENKPIKTVLSVQTAPLEVYHGILGIRQTETERYLTEYLTELPDWTQGGKKKMSIRRGVALESFTEGPMGVQCHLKLPEGTQTVTCKFLVACDGGRSTIRHQLGYSFDGTTTPEYFFGLDACFENWEFDSKDVVSVSLTQDKDPLAPGFAFNIPFGDGNCLLLVDLDLQQQKGWVTGETDRNGFPVLRQPEVEDVLRVARSRGLGQQCSVKPGSVKWLTHFRVNSRQVQCYGRGRVFLAGDACHCHSPFGGQGMNMGFQDAKNLSWKLATAIKCGGPTSSLLLSYESERKTLESKLLAGIERGQEVVSSRNPLIFFMRGRGQRLVNMLTFLQPTILKTVAQQMWSYRTSSLSMEHWERPVPTCFPITSICPAGGYRRRQNLHRWVKTRVHAGDRVPDASLPGGMRVHQILKRSRGWTLLLFEGGEEENLDMEKHLGNKVLSLSELEAFGAGFKSTSDPTNFVPMVDEVICFPAQDVEAHHIFGVHGQCLFLVRPDHYVGFRCEPLRRGAVYRYFRLACGISHGMPEDAPASSRVFDPLPVIVWTLILLLVIFLNDNTATNHACTVTTVFEFSSLVSKSLSSLSVLDVIEEPSIQSNDAAMVAARALGFKGFDAAQAAPADVQTQAAIRLRGKLRSKELAQLRQLVEGDERFARLLERHCKAIHELIALGNPAPVLAVLAGLVWSSLSIAWELDTSHMPKARMKNEIEQLKVKLQKVMDNFSESRMCYLKERQCCAKLALETVRALDRDRGSEGSGDWADLLRPRQAEADEALRVGFSILGEPTLVPSKGIAVGTEPSFDAAVQSDGPLLDEEALSVLSARDAARITGFLRGLRDTRSGFDATTVEALLRLLKSLPAPDGPKILLNAIRQDQPALFERLHESMRRTQQRTSAGTKQSGC